MEGLSDVSLVPRGADCCGTFSCVPSFFGGVFVVVLVEIVFVCYFVSKLLGKKGKHSSSTDSSLAYESEPGSISFSLQGNLWVAPLPEGDLSKAVLQKPGKDKKKEKDKDKKKEKDKEREKETEKDGSKESSKRGESTKDVIEIAPVWRHVVLKGGDLLLKAADGTEEHISLEGCEVFSVSAGTTVGGKWAKRYPIKLHHPTRTLYRECKSCLFYAESGYEKEAWCEVLRATARANDWCTQLKKEFREYTGVAETHVPYVTSFHSTREANHFVAAHKEEKSDDHKNPEENVSKKRILLNKLLRRNSKGKDNNRSPNAEEELGNFTRRFSSHLQVQDEGSSRRGKDSAIFDDHEDNKSASRASHVSNESISRSDSTSSDSDAEKSTTLATTQKTGKDSDEVLGAILMRGHDNGRVQKEMDQGLLCLNMLVGRLFFDFYHSKTRVEWVQNHFQKLISKIKTPTYIKSITIKELNLGNDPPFATALRMLPADAAGALAMEVDFEWYGGGFITIETRIDVRDQIAQEKVASHMAKPGSAGAAAAAIVSDIGEDLEDADLSSTVSEVKEADVTKKTGPGDDSSIKGRWMNSVKSMMSRVADQVSQLPLMLKIRMVSVKGTCIISLRAPPSDRIWFSFKEMPNIDLEPEPIIGEHRISSGPLGTFIANQIKVQVRESIVLPLWQDLSLHWMMAEEDDWLPESAVPIAFSAIPKPEHELQNSKHNLDVQAKPTKENDKSVQSLVPRNGQNKPETLENSEIPPHNLDHGPTSPTPPQIHSSSDGAPITQMQPSTVPHSQSTPREASGASMSQSRFSAKSSQSSSEHSFASRPSEASLRSSAPASIREENESDLTEPLVDFDVSKKEKLLGSSREFDSGASERAAGRPLDTDLLLHSESLGLERESQNPPNQVSKQESPSVDLSKEPDSSASSRRTKIFSLGKKTLEGGKKKVGSALEETRRLVQEKMNREKKEGGEGGSSRHLGGGN
ncbi:hypothetical protein KC19_6G184800 [Ceratodon purpureus]|uniref:SMP-LTD domain-containing protein n=1 Tax=Ceratodon purpureus TaxID=3225 RepID=A0A8T0HG63_CERPU|nr:hypothetical protein KC19_6G184800 [Ceratodon purpureus]